MCLLNQVGCYASSLGTLFSPLLTPPFCGQQDRQCSSESCNGGRVCIRHGRGNYKRSPQAVSWQTGKLHLLMDARYCIHGAGNLQKWKGKLTENGRKYQQTETGHGKRKRGSLLTLAFCKTPNAEISVSLQLPHIPTHRKH